MEFYPDQIETREGPWLPVPVDPGGRHPGVISAKKLDLWALVLESRSVPYRIDASESGRQLLVPVEFMERALNELRLFEEENRNWPPPPLPVRVQEENTLSTLSVLLLLAIFHNLTLLRISLPGYGIIDWHALGSARAADIVHGEWWRAVTALTLHTGIVHLGSNLLVGGAIIVLLCREIGSGLAWSLVLASGILGNMVNAYLQLPTHISVGSSTALFGAVGVLTAFSLIRHRQNPSRRWVIPVAAGLALLAALGTEGTNTDIGAHLLGFVWGVCLGVPVGVVVDRRGRPGPVVNAALVVLCAAVVVLSWWVAVSFVN